MEEQLNEETKRKLASIRVIKKIEPIEGADLIELAYIDGWQVVTAKDNGFKEGDLVIYCEIDSFLPIKPEFEFLRKSSLKNMGGVEGFRLKTIRLRGQISQGLIMPLSLAEEAIRLSRMDPVRDYPPFEGFQEGEDVTDLLGIIKYEKPIPAELAGMMKGDFPSFIPKTDEERVQNIKFNKIREAIANTEDKYWIVTEKLEGTSATFYRKDEVFGVCSRNIDLEESESNTYWKIARELDLENKFKTIDYNIAIQGELIGPGIQGNHYQLTETKLKVFSGWNIDEQRYLTGYELHLLAKDLGLELVPQFTKSFIIDESHFNSEFWVKVADGWKEPNVNNKTGFDVYWEDGKSLINPSKMREGIVVRTESQKISFKAISNRYLLKQED